MIRLPRTGTRPYQVLHALLDAPGTFYQICERIHVDLAELGMEPTMRAIFDNLALAQIRLDGITYSITNATRLAIQGKPPAPRGSVAGPHYRGPGVARPVLVITRATPAAGGGV